MRTTLQTGVASAVASRSCAAADVQNMRIAPATTQSARPFPSTYWNRATPRGAMGLPIFSRPASGTKGPERPNDPRAGRRRRLDLGPIRTRTDEDHSGRHAFLTKGVALRPIRVLPALAVAMLPAVARASMFHGETLDT